MSFLEHLGELRGRLIICAVAICLTTVVFGIFFANRTVNVLTRPFTRLNELTGRQEALRFQMTADGLVRVLNLGAFLEKRFARGDGMDQGSRFIRGFLTASLVFCVGPMAILGSIQDGLSGDYSLLAIKSVLDGFAALAFSSLLGAGVLFSALAILVYQGMLTLLAAQVQSISTPAMMNEMTAAGGVLLIGLAVSSLLELKPIRVGNFLPALVIAPLIVAVLAALGIGQ